MAKEVVKHYRLTSEDAKALFPSVNYAGAE